MLADIGTLRDYLKLPATDTTQDVFLTTLLSWSGAQIRNMCGQEIELTQAEPLVFSGPRGNAFTLPNHPVQSVVSLKSRSQTNTTTWDRTYTPYGATAGEYEFDRKTNSIYMLGGFIEGTRNYQIVYTYGYTQIPPDVQAVAIEMAAIAYKESGKAGNDAARLGVSSTSVNMSGVTTSKSFLDMAPIWRSQLDSYRYLGTF